MRRHAKLAMLICRSAPHRDLPAAATWFAHTTDIAMDTLLNALAFTLVMAAPVLAVVARHSAWPEIDSSGPRRACDDLPAWHRWPLE